MACDDVQDWINTRRTSKEGRRGHERVPRSGGPEFNSVSSYAAMDLWDHEPDRKYMGDLPDPVLPISRYYLSVQLYSPPVNDGS